MIKWEDQKQAPANRAAHAETPAMTRIKVLRNQANDDKTAHGTKMKNRNEKSLSVRWRRALIAFFALVVVSSASRPINAQESPALLQYSIVSENPYVEQMKFSAEDESVQQPAKIPADVWAVLQKDSSVLDVLSSLNLGADQLPASWFAASEAHLNGTRESDLIVVAKGLLQGANVTTFWVFTRGPAGVTLVLSVPAHDLAIRTSRTNGYRDIQAMVATAGRVSVATFRFDGQKYQAPKK